MDQSKPLSAHSENVMNAKLRFGESLYLEERVAPAIATVSYIDADGDLVKVTASKPGVVAPPLDMADLTLSGGASGQLQKVNLTDAGFDGASVIVSVIPKPGGDALA